jgi:predicted helicase
MNNYLLGNNLGLNIVRQSKGKGVETLITNYLTNRDFITNHTFNFPLYLYPETSGQLTIGENITERKPNLNQEIVDKIADGLGARFVAEKPTPSFGHPSYGGEFATQNQQSITGGEFAPIDILDYIYAVLHSPTYREKYKEFLKIDFPRVPYPKDVTTFWELVKLGGEIRQIHLLESEVVENYITQYPNDGNNVVGKIHYENNKVYINYDKSSPLGIEGLQYFDNVPEVAWNFYIGGYQPAQKWLKDRKDRILDFEDILHYQKIIVALSETDRLMKEIDKVEIE